jgi:hypothetical protein
LQVGCCLAHSLGILPRVVRKKAPSLETAPPGCGWVRMRGRLPTLSSRSRL